MTASKYMKVAANINRGLHLAEPPSIRAVLELLAEDKPPSWTKPLPRQVN
jgi:hypothetical protein